VTGGHDTRVSLAALIAVRPGCRPAADLPHAPRPPRRISARGSPSTDYALLLDGAHQQLGGPLVLVWDGLNTHTSRAMRELIAARAWLTVFQLPAYAPELNPVEPVLVQLQTIAGQSHQARHPSADRAGQDPAPADASTAQASSRASSPSPASTSHLSGNLKN
jgi:hypothetical protein